MSASIILLWGGCGAIVGHLVALWSNVGAIMGHLGAGMGHLGAFRGIKGLPPPVDIYTGAWFGGKERIALY